MARLPIPGQDQGTWGDILNEYLSQSLKSDGHIQDNAVTATALAPNSVTNNAIAPNAITATEIASDTITAAVIADGSITEALLHADVQSKLNVVAGTPEWDDITNKPAVIAAGATQADARTVIGAGTSNLVIGTSSTTAKAGDYAPTKSDLGLSNVDNTSDATKNSATVTLTNKTINGSDNTLSNIPQAAIVNLTSDLTGKAASVHTHTAIQISDSTITGRSVLTAVDAAAVRTAIGAGVSNLTLGTSSSTAKAGDYAPTKTDVGLGNVDNTSDATKNSATTTLTNKTISGASNTLSNVGVTSLSATGTRDTTTFLRGDNTWAVPSGGGGGGNSETIYHDTNAATVRPSIAGVVTWVGSVEPDNALDGDVWLDVSGDAPLVITTVLNSMNEDTPMTTQTLVATGSTPVTWALTTGSLPAGVSLSSAGELSGTPTSGGAYDFTVTATNGYGDDDQQYAGTVGGGTAPTVTTTVLNALAQDSAFSQTLGATGSVPITWSVSAGSIVSGLSLSSSGVLSGTPSGTGAYNFTVTATNSFGSDTQQYTGTISGAVAPTVTTTTLNSQKQGTVFSQTLAATGSTPITWSVTAGTLPSGLALNASTGEVSGTPAAAGAYSFTITATNAAGSDDQAFTGTVAAGIEYYGVGSGYTWGTPNAFSPPNVTCPDGGTALLFMWMSNQSNNSNITTVSLGGQTMTAVGSAASIGGASGYYAFARVYKLEGISGAGSKALSISFPGAQAAVMLQVVVYTGGTVGSLQSTALLTTTSLAQNDVVSSSGHIVVQSFMTPWVYGAATAYNKTTRYSFPNSGNPYRPFVIGEAAGAADVDFSATVPSATPQYSIGLAVDLS